MPQSSRRLSVSGQALLDTPLLNKGTAFSNEERSLFHLHGRLPVAVHTLDEQVAQAYSNVMAQPDTLSRHVTLRTIQDSNETLFYALLDRHLREMMPLVYTPGVGQACQEFSKIWQRPRGLFLSAEHKGHIADLIASSEYDNIRLIIVTDGERILGLGDLGANGMGIPIGKISLYTACAGLNPELLLPVTLDVGTNNTALRDDPSYIGSRSPRLRGEAYAQFVEEFVTAIKKRWPSILLHWEDFAGPNAAPLLQRYREALPSFNDDIQGTAAITTAAILSGVKANKQTLAQQRIVIVGGGSAGCGIANQLFQALLADGLKEEEARALFFILDRPGLLTQDMPNLTQGQKPFARHEPSSNGQGRDLASVISDEKPTILIGVSGQADIFSEEIIRTMAAHCDRPLIFPLSNPTSHVEATPEDILHWTDGRALVSTGSPFAPVHINGRTIPIDQTNNAYIFPGLGLGALACHTQQISDRMLMKAAQAIAEHSADHPEQASLLPPLEEMKNVALAVARAVAYQAREEKLCPDFDDATLNQRLAELSWAPLYSSYVPA
ncbi:oxaloacetate-decarboxylating malate dehydrogenase [Saccharibacter sp. 17.LH.SD]|uniref:NAD-dependent malic enzyme n=1 Tax=Saccharibacter sp. 17.LH.SD TaxID=2689393 RepID=UPI0013711E34|nr:NAD-dependent malic enzyme [Saccharibacter sp. 17.LH.SD]MXV43946.1 oxaloacetate-decarboxylating malate dehydrogenase [Saccharibacter sp. 17.LH.SD]